jgi:hypothetical protein
MCLRLGANALQGSLDTASLDHWILVSAFDFVRVYCSKQYGERFGVHVAAIDVFVLLDDVDGILQVRTVYTCGTTSGTVTIAPWRIL